MSESAVKALIHERPELSTRTQLGLKPGGLFTTFHKGAIPPERAQSISNCNVDRSIWELDKRYRRVKSSPSGTTGSGIGYGYYNGTERIIAFENGNMYQIDISQIDSTTPSAGAAWSADLDSTVTNTGDWITWQAGKYEWAANETNGLRWIEIGTSTVGGGQTALPTPTNSIQMTKDTTAAISSNLSALRHVGGNTTTWTLASAVTVTNTENGQVLTATNPSGTNVSPGTTHTITIDFGSTFGGLGQNNSEYIAFFIKAYTNASITMLDTTASSEAAMTVELGNAGGTIWEHVTVYTRFDGLPGTDANKVFVLCDVRTSMLWANGGVRQIRILFEGINTSAAAGTYWELSHILRPGCMIDRENSLSEDFEGELELGYTFFNITTGAESPMSPTTLVADKAYLHGEYAFTDQLSMENHLPRWGAKLAYTIDLGTSLPSGITSADFVRVYRRVGDTWYRIVNVLISAAFTTTPRFTYTTYLQETAYYSKTAASTTYDGNRSLDGQSGTTCGTSWKRSNVFFKTNGYAYFSRQNAPHDFYLGGLTKTRPINPGDFARPRTIQISDNLNPVLAAVSQDALYMFTARECYVMTGEGPAKATPPRKVPRSLGVLGKRAACPWKAGALYATRLGLFYVEVANSWDGNEDGFVYEEVSKENRGQWATLLGATESDWAKLVVAVHDDEIWMVCRTRYLRLTKMGNWIYGTLTDAVKALVADPTRGLIGQTEAGKLIVFGDYTTDDGVTLAGDAGTAVTWSWRSMRFMETATLFRTILKYEYTTTAAITVKGYTERDSTPSSLSFTGTNLWEAFKMTDPPNGAWFEIELAGGAADKVVSCVIELAPAHEGGVT